MKTDEHLYTLTRLEFAKSIGKSKNAVKLAMMRGKYKDLYIFKNKKYFFKSREAMRENHGLEPITVNPLKRKINRGNHDKPGAYASSTMKRVPPQFKVRNAMVKLMSAKGKIKPEDQKYVHILEKKTEQWLREEKQKSLKVNTMYSLSDHIRRDTLGDKPGVNLKSYSSGLFSCGSNKGYGTPQYFGGNTTDNRSYQNTNRGSSKPKKGPYEI
jgi:hypothetical protein|tara:strand:+ start:2983 stop:3621 length:639 start_codon:yes stop_codon:yes gene_type:complete